MVKSSAIEVVVQLWIFVKHQRRVDRFGCVQQWKEGGWVSTDTILVNYKVIGHLAEQIPRKSVEAGDRVRHLGRECAFQVDHRNWTVAALDKE